MLSNRPLAYGWGNGLAWGRGHCVRSGIPTLAKLGKTCLCKSFGKLQRKQHQVKRATGAARGLTGGTAQVGSQIPHPMSVRRFRSDSPKFIVALPRFDPLDAIPQSAPALAGMLDSGQWPVAIRAAIKADTNVQLAS